MTKSWEEYHELINHDPYHPTLGGLGVPRPPPKSWEELFDQQEIIKQHDNRRIKNHLPNTPNHSIASLYMYARSYEEQPSEAVPEVKPKEPGDEIADEKVPDPGKVCVVTTEEIQDPG